MFKVGITGSRDGMTMYQRDTLTIILATRPFTDTTPSLHHGDCAGVDEQAHAIAVKLGYHIYVYPPENDSYRAYCVNMFEPSIGVAIVMEPKPYLARNKDIVNACEHLIVVPDSAVERNRSGTWSTLQYAEKIGRQFTIITPDGSEPVRLEQ